MVDSFSEFEDELRGLVPAGCDRLTEDTFYRAGWKAAEASFAARVSERRSRYRPVRVFVTGLSCGLLLSVAGLLNRQSSVGDAASVAVTATDGAQDVSVVTDRTTRESSAEASDMDVAAVRDFSDSPGELTFGMPELVPWNWLSGGGIADPVSAESQPLSSAARRFGRAVVAADSSMIRTDGGVRARSTVPEPVPLRSSPLTQAVVDELL